MITSRTTSFTQTEKTILSTEPAIDCNNGPSSSLSRSSTNSRRPKTPHLCKSSSGRSSWNMKSLREVLPETPSPICSTSLTSPLSSSTSSPKSDTFFTQLPIEPLPTPKNQSFCTAENGVKNSRIEVDDCMEHTKHFGRFNHPNMQNNYPKGKEEIPVLEEYSGQASAHSMYEASDEGSQNALRRRLMTRPKPYSTFLDEVKKQELEDEIEAWRKAKQMEIMSREGISYLAKPGRLKTKEADISKWEFKHTSKAMEEMKRLESKLEKKRAKALEKLQKRISTTKAEAHKKSAKVRRETIEKIAAISQVSSKALATKNSLWNKLTRLS
ncbi:hypothetical protein TIFTF001_025441 [Ficus carica]|uniref:Remorin C-terminal domain-containing protein n=1 Tax=Ficus carica TaxID=3494 RepID=A0AA88AP63_FICCA|nr:hypothetical protein TIFTF001_025441 [Ficus carica]